MLPYTLSIEIREDLNLAVWRVTGALPMPVMTECLRSYVAEGSYRPGMNLLSVNSNITSSYSQDELDMLMRAIGTAYGPMRQDIRCASVFSEELQFGLARMFQVTVEDSVLTFKPFRTLEEARIWLEVPEEAVIDRELPDHGTVCVRIEA